MCTRRIHWHKQLHQDGQRNGLQSVHELSACELPFLRGLHSPCDHGTGIPTLDFVGCSAELEPAPSCIVGSCVLMPFFAHLIRICSGRPAAGSCRTLSDIARRRKITTPTVKMRVHKRECWSCSYIRVHKCSACGLRGLCTWGSEIPQQSAP